jgi:hypothetical protein
MAEVELRTLRVSAQVDAGQYKAGAADMVAADKSMVASKRELGQAVAANDSKISQSGDALAKLTRLMIDGAGTQQKFAQGLGVIQRSLDTGKVSIEGAAALLVGMNQKLGLTADVTVFAAKGLTQMAEAATIANARIEANTGSLSRAVGEYQIYIAQLKEAQAAQNSSQFASANQNKFNSLLGVQTQPSSSARESASVFAAGLQDIDNIAQLKAQQIGQNFGNDLNISLVAGSSKSARDAAAAFSTELDRIDALAQLKATQIGANFQSDLNASLGVGSFGGGSARASASVFEEAGREADQMASKVAALRAELNPVAAAQDRLNAELAEFNNLAAKGAISAEELAAAQTMARSRAAANQGGLNRFGAMNATSQLQDIAITSAMGQSPMTIALQQGTQLGMAMQMSGVQGGAGLVKSLSTAFTGLLTETNLVAIGLTAVAAIAIQFGSKLFDGFKSAEEKAREFNKLLSDQKEIIQSLGPAYAEAARQQQSTGPFESVGVGRLVLQQNLDDARKASQEQGRTALKEIQGSSGTFMNLMNTLPEGLQKSIGIEPAYIEFKRIINAASDGEMSINDARTALQRFGEVHPDFSYLIGRFLQMSEEAAKTERQVGGLVGILDRFAKIRLPEAGVLPKGVAGDQIASATLAAQNRMQQQFAADNLANFAKSPQELAAAARARAALNPQGSAAEQATRVELAGKRALIDAEHALKEAQDQRLRSLNQTLASAQLDVELVGKTKVEIDSLRMAAQLEAQVREEAAQHNITNETEIQRLYGKEIAQIKEKAAATAMQKAIADAGTALHGREQELELQRAEVGLLGQNTLAREAEMAALKTEQDIRERGIPLYGKEAEGLRAVTAAESANAEARARASMQADLLFQRSQILRNSTDQAIAAAQQSAGLPIDLNSAEANMMRYNMALQETKDTFKGFATDMLSSLKEGKTVWESFATAATNALGKIADKLIDQGLDGIFNNLFGGESAGGGTLGALLSGNSGQSGSSAGGASSILSNLFGGGRSQSVATMQVQAATVFINGSPVGGVAGGLGSLLGGSGFQANTTLSDILGYGGGAANQNMIQSRIDGAFGTTGQDYIQKRIDQAFGTTAAGFGGIMSPAGGFASVLGGGLTGSMSSYASAIKMIESAGSGGYSALGPVLKSGDQALGAYQVMRSNLPSWSTEAFGKPMSQSQFMSDPAAQDAIFSQQFGKYLSKYGNPQDAASAWFTGGPLSAGAGKSDVLGTTGSKYVDMFNDNLKKMGGSASQASSALSGLGGASEGLISQFSKMGQSLLSQLTPATSSTSWFQGLSGMFGGSSGALGFMSSISPAATSDILSGSWGLFDTGGFTGLGGKNQPAGIVHRGEIVWSQNDIARAGGVGAVEGMRRGYAGYADGGYADRIRMRFSSGRHNDNMGAAASNSNGRSGSVANDRPAQNIQQTNNFIFRENPAAPASQNQIAQKSAKALERLTRVS